MKMSDGLALLMLIVGLFVMSSAFKVPRPKALVVNCKSHGSAGVEFQHRLKWRQNAEDQATIWLFAGEQLKIHFDIASDATVDVLDVRYSNDGDFDDIAISLDGQRLGDFKTQTHYAWGNLWNIFRSSGPIGGHQYLRGGAHTITLSVENSDIYGVEIDYIRLNVHGSKVERMENEHFFCEHKPGFNPYF